jgi:hypothetical protein
MRELVQMTPRTRGLLSPPLAREAREAGADLQRRFLLAASLTLPRQRGRETG